MSESSLHAALLALPPAKRLDIIGFLTESLENTPDALPLTAEQRAELDRRGREMREDPQLGSTWEQVKSRHWPKG